MEAYYGIPFEVMAKVQGCFAGPAAECAPWLASYAAAGIEHVIVRLPGEQFREQLRSLAREVAPRLRAVPTDAGAPG